MVSRNRTPVTTEAKPVFAPSPTPDADSMYEVLDETEPAPPAAAAIESINRMRSAPSTLPLRSTNQAC